jgi:sulfate adenylyltransferase
MKNESIIHERYFTTAQSDELLSRKDMHSRLKLSKENIEDANNIANGAYSPLRGFLKKADFVSVLHNMRLANGLIWSIPIVLDISQQQARTFKNANRILLQNEADKIIGEIRNFEIYEYDKNEYAKSVFGTIDKMHPGVEAVFRKEELLIGGDIRLFSAQTNRFFEYHYAPLQTRSIFQRRGWQKIVAFQTRNIPHRAHEFLQLESLKHVDGLMIQPVIGEKKLEDFKDELIIKSYEMLIHKYYPLDRVLLAALPLKMRYAGPREAVFHALIRRNHGCTHFIVGRDHAGVGSYYSPFAAQEIFDVFTQDEVGIEIMKFPEIVYSKTRKDFCFADDCPPSDRLDTSGSKLRSYIKNGDQPPEYLIRPEVFNILTNERQSPLVDVRYNNRDLVRQHGFVLWFTGLSQSGKSTIADGVYNLLMKNGLMVERLDGDIVRESLTKDLGFSKEDRDENIRRVGFVARLLSRNNIGVIASFISPYRNERDQLRLKITNYIEIFVNTPLEICERRDRKGLYQKARAGQMPCFTGISDPYEEPVDHELELRPAEFGVDECVEQVIEYLRDKNYIEIPNSSLQS